MADSNILSDFGINILEEEIDDVIFQPRHEYTAGQPQPCDCPYHKFCKAF